MTSKLQRLLRASAVGVVAGMLGVNSSLFIVYPGEACIVYNKLYGLRESVYDEGIHFRIFGLEDVKTFKIQIRPRTLFTETGTKDLQMVNVKLRVLFRPIAEQLPGIFRTFGMDYDERILPSISNEILKSVVAEYKAEELIQKRDVVSTRIYELMDAKLKNFGIHVEDISLVDIQFGKDFMAAVEQKQVAQQEAERFRYVVQENEQKRKAAVIRAEGEAESARLISSAIAASGTAFLDLRRIEATVDIVSNVASHRNTTFIPGNMMMMMNPTTP